MVVYAPQTKREFRPTEKYEGWQIYRLYENNTPKNDWAASMKLELTEKGTPTAPYDIGDLKGDIHENNISKLGSFQNKFQVGPKPSYSSAIKITRYKRA